MPRAAVTLRIKASGLVITGAIANPDGSFRLTGLRPGVFILRSTYLGYAPQVQEMTLDDAHLLRRRVDCCREAISLEAEERSSF